MAKALTTRADSQLTQVDIRTDIKLTVNNIDVTSNMLSHNISYSTQFGVANFTFELINNNGIYSDGGASEIKLGYEVILEFMFAGATDRFFIFHGYIRPSGITIVEGRNTIQVQAMDFIVKLQETDVDKVYEADKIAVTNEILSPVFLADPNAMYASIFNFANENIAEDPPPNIRIRNQLDKLEDPQFSGFEVNYATGQMTLGSLLNARDNFEVVVSYHFYPLGLYIEDIVEDLIKLPDGYSQYNFGETSAQGIVDNHLTTDLNAEEGTDVDTMLPNFYTVTYTIKSALTAAVIAGDTSGSLDTSGFPSSGTANINGDTFTWTGKTTTTLTGIPATGASAVLAHAIGAYVVYEADYSSGQLWYHLYNNRTTTLTSSDYTITPVGAGTPTIEYFNKRDGLIILDARISTQSVVTCNTNYSFKTIQSAGIEINKITFAEREVANRFEAVNQLRKSLAPNYLIRTKGTDLIWATYVNQLTTADYDLKAIHSLNYSEDQDFYTRCIFYGSSQNPHNIMFDDGVSLLDSGAEYSAVTTNTELTYVEDKGQQRVYRSGLEIGKIILNGTQGVRPVVYLNSNPIDNNMYEVIQSDCVISQRVKTETTTKSGGSSTDVTITTYYYYKVYFSHTGIEPSQVIHIYNATGIEIYSLGPNEDNFDYEQGIWNVPGNKENEVLITASTATYWILYSTNSLQIDYDNVLFYIDRTLVPDVTKALVSATFEYQTVMTPINGAGRCFDGRWDTQTQTIFYSKPPSGYVYTIVDLGSIQNIQTIDMIAGFFKPDPDGRRRFEMTNFFTLKYSLDNLAYYDVSPETNNFSINSGDTNSWETDILGENFKARYFKLIIEDLGKVEYGNGAWVVAFVEFAAFNEVILRGEAKLVPTTELSLASLISDTTITVKDATSFPSGAGTGYYRDTNRDLTSFTYTGKTATSFTGVAGASAFPSGTQIVQYEADDDNEIYDVDYLLQKVGDVVFKDKTINEYLDTETKVKKRAKDYLTEFYKNHTKGSADLFYAPHLQVGHTVKVDDSENRVERNYFAEQVNHSQLGTTVQLAYYP